MTGLTFNEGLQWLITVGLSTASTLVSGVIIKFMIDGGRTPSDTAKEYISYIVPFVLVGMGYGGQVVFGYLAFNVDTAFAFVLNAGVVAFGSQFIYTAYKSSKKPPMIAAVSTISPRTVLTLEDPAPADLAPGDPRSVNLDEWREPDPLTASTPAELQYYVSQRGQQGAPVPPQEREG